MRQPKQSDSGLQVWGKQTLSRTSSALDKVNCRRFALFVEKKLVAGLDGKIPFHGSLMNKEATMAVIRMVISEILQTACHEKIVKQFRVVCDSSNNSSEDRDKNTIHVDIHATPYNQRLWEPVNNGRLFGLDLTMN